MYVVITDPILRMICLQALQDGNHVSLAPPIHLKIIKVDSLGATIHHKVDGAASTKNGGARDNNLPTSNLVARLGMDECGRSRRRRHVG